MHDFFFDRFSFKIFWFCFISWVKEWKIWDKLRRPPLSIVILCLKSPILWYYLNRVLLSFSGYLQIWSLGYTLWSKVLNKNCHLMQKINFWSNLGNFWLNEKFWKLKINFSQKVWYVYYQLQAKNVKKLRKIFPLFEQIGFILGHSENGRKTDGQTVVSLAVLW